MFVLREDISKHFTISELIQYTNDDPVARTVDYSKIDVILNFVNSLIEDSLRDRYALPLDPVSPVVHDIGESLAIYKVIQLRNRNKMPADIQKMYDDNIALLKAYEKGDINLPGYKTSTFFVTKSPKKRY